MIFISVPIPNGLKQDILCLCEGLLCGDIKIRNERLFLHYIVLRGGSPSYDGKGGCRVFVKIYQGMAQVFELCWVRAPAKMIAV